MGDFNIIKYKGKYRFSLNEYELLLLRRIVLDQRRDIDNKKFRGSKGMKVLCNRLINETKEFINKYESDQ